MTRRFFLLFLLLLISALTTACSPFVTSTPPPSPQLLQVSYTPTLRHWTETLNQCALDHPETALILQETSLADLEFTKADIALWYGEPPQGIPGYAASLGVDEILIIAGSDVALRNINAEKLREIYSETASVYHIWTYDEGNELRAIFDNTVLFGVSLSSDATLAPSPTAMLEAVSADPMALGYLPQSWLTENVQKISIDRELQIAFEQPILALTDTEPEGNLKRYLNCLQQNSNP